jgi:hypothetical protein
MSILSGSVLQRHETVRNLEHHYIHEAGSLLFLNIQNLWDLIPRQSYSSDVWKDHSAFICSIKQSQRNSLHFIFKNVASNTYSFTIWCHNLVQKFMKPTQHNKTILNYQRCLAIILTTMK